MSKIRVAVIYGGRSTEHEISILSAKNIVSSMPKDKYDPILIGIDKEGQWLSQHESIELIDTTDPSTVKLADQSSPVIISQNTDDHKIIHAETFNPIGQVDVIFPVLHGTYGEDGAIQGFAKLANLPCVGPSILGSAIGMDKEVMKRLIRDSDIKNAPFVTLRKSNKKDYSYKKISETLGQELFIKPVNMGSSVGVSYIDNEAKYQDAIDHAFIFDNKVIIEKRIYGREIECAILGNDDPIASIPGEVIPKTGFYSYESKYIDENGANLEIPAKLTKEQVSRIQDLAIKTYQCLECSGMARVDMFMTKDGALYINEINTIPGFTDISMYPTLWKISGISNNELIDRLIELAIAEHKALTSLKLSH